MNLRMSLVFVAFLLPGVARAGGFATARFGGEAGHPTTASPTAIYFNPAGLALGTGTRIYVEGLIASHTVRYVRPAAAIDNLVSSGAAESGTPAAAVSANSGPAELAGIVAAPFLGVVSDLGIANLGVGLAFYVPFGGEAKWDDNPAYEGSQLYPGALDGVQRWAIIDGSLRSYYLSAAAAYTIPGPRLSFGASLNLVKNEINFLRARTTSATDNMVGANGTVIEGRSLIEAHDYTYALGVGAVWQPAANLWLGLSYQSQPGFGTTAMRGELTNKFGATAVEVTPIDFEQALPDIVRLGASYRLGQSELRFAADYTRWSKFDKQCLLATSSGANCSLTESGAMADDGAGVIINVQRDFTDTFSVRVGGSHRFHADLEVGGSVTYDSNAIPDATLDASIIDMNKLVFQAGANYAVTRELSLSLTLGKVVYFEREVAPRERDADGDPLTFAAPSRNPDGAGTYEQSISMVLLGVGYAL